MLWVTRKASDQTVVLLVGGEKIIISCFVKSKNYCRIGIEAHKTRVIVKRGEDFDAHGNLKIEDDLNGKEKSEERTGRRE